MSIPPEANKGSEKSPAPLSRQLHEAWARSMRRAVTLVKEATRDYQEMQPPVGVAPDKAWEASHSTWITARNQLLQAILTDPWSDVPYHKASSVICEAKGVRLDDRLYLAVPGLGASSEAVGEKRSKSDDARMILAIVDPARVREIGRNTICPSPEAAAAAGLTTFMVLRPSGDMEYRLYADAAEMQAEIRAEFDAWKLPVDTVVTDMTSHFSGWVNDRGQVVPHSPVPLAPLRADLFRQPPPPPPPSAPEEIPSEEIPSAADAQTTVGAQPDAIGAIVSILPEHNQTVLVRNWRPGDAARCTRCPKGECVVNTQDTCLVVYPGVFPPGSPELRELLSGTLPARTQPVPAAPERPPVHRPGRPGPTEADRAYFNAATEATSDRQVDRGSELPEAYSVVEECHEIYQCARPELTRDQVIGEELAAGTSFLRRYDRVVWYGGRCLAVIHRGEQGHPFVTTIPQPDGPGAVTPQSSSNAGHAKSTPDPADDDADASDEAQYVLVYGSGTEQRLPASFLTLDEMKHALEQEVQAARILGRTIDRDDFAVFDDDGHLLAIAKYPPEPGRPPTFVRFDQPQKAAPQ